MNRVYLVSHLNESQRLCVIGVYSSREKAQDVCTDDSFVITPYHLDQVSKDVREHPETFSPNTTEYRFEVIPYWDVHFDEVHRANVRQFETITEAHEYLNSMNSKLYDDIRIKEIT